MTTHSGSSYIDIGVTCSSDVNICGIGMNGTDGLANGWYYCLAEATLQCDVSDGQTPAPTVEPTQNDESYDMYNLTIVTQFDAAPEDLFWVLYDVYAGDYLWYDDGSSSQYQPYDTFTYSTTVGHGCYVFYIVNSTYYDVDTSADFFGYYSIYVNSIQITYGNEPITPTPHLTLGAFGFCTTFTDVPSYGVSSIEHDNYVPDCNIQIKTSNFDGDIMFMDLSIDSEFYQMDVWYTKYDNYNPYNPAKNNIPISHGCYGIYFYSYDNNPQTRYSVNITDLNMIILSKTSTDDTSYSWAQFCTNGTIIDVYNHSNQHTTSDGTITTVNPIIDTSSNTVIINTVKDTTTNPISTTSINIIKSNTMNPVAINSSGISIKSGTKGTSDSGNKKSEGADHSIILIVAVFGSGVVFGAVVVAVIVMKYKRMGCFKNNKMYRNIEGALEGETLTSTL